MPSQGEVPTNTYRSVEYARTFFAQLAIFEAISLMWTEVNEPVWQSSYAHRSATAVPLAVAVDFPQAVHTR